MDTSREDVGISIRSAFLRKGTQQRFSLFVLTIISILLIFLETIETKPLNRIRSFIKDVVYRTAVVVTYPTKIFSGSYNAVENHFSLYENYNEVIKLSEEVDENTLNLNHINYILGSTYFVINEYENSLNFYSKFTEFEL